MPRISGDAVAMLEVVQKTPVEVVRRVAAPPELTEEQEAEFQRVVQGMPADWFCVGNIAMLVQYCRHVVMARRIAAAIEDAVRNGDVLRLEGLLKAQARESKLISQLMTSLRLTPQAVEPRGISAGKMKQLQSSPWHGFGKAKTRSTQEGA